LSSIRTCACACGERQLVSKSWFAAWIAPILVRSREIKEKWSAQEHAGHLLDLEALWMARVDDYLSGASQLTVADLSNRKTFEAQHNRRADR
jgi:hypothetical protein